MRKIVLFCSAGMSTSILVNKMIEAAKAIDYDCTVEAHSVSEVARLGADADIVLLGPQVRFNLAGVQKTLPGKPVEVIDMRMYGTMNGAAVIDHVRKVLGDDK
ncbi:PTS sugar transporter subunit IIB [Erysipelothrix larvae]|uniref:PTS sugar transporter subunit IIB n=1 Tax=Erysipelothrix larvae TaxID=1514105 RepID=A0A0X8GZI8_9FIRM|nr:PTS sugar transporter subunit IIB [Erysipelothrix larvae]AMC93119.1 PTS sugar transporter subunit IIB [Erysipelothrix larvae]